MKFQKLTIHNIASIEDAVIDFESKPLVDSEVFLITGKTGAGKTTILDAICLALYADTPRLDGTKMQGETKDVDRTVKINDPRQLMRRNTGEAFASLTFIGANGVRYEAIWSVARARKKATGNMQAKDWQLKNLDTNCILSKDKEIEAEIKEAIGLDFNQFCRTTMLAQGEFTRFLNSKDDEKAEILEKITGVDIYSKIGAKVYALTCQKEQIWKEARQLVEGARTLTEEEILEKQNALLDLDVQYSGLKAQSDRDTAKRDWIKVETELIRGVDEADEVLRKANEVIESDEFKQKKTLIDEWNATIDARAWAIEVQEAKSEQEKQRGVVEGLSDEFVLLLGGQKFVESEIEKLETELREIDAFLSVEAEKSSIYNHAQTIVGYLSVISDGRDAIAQNNASITIENRALVEELEPAYEKARQNVKLAKEAFDQAEADVVSQEEALNALKLYELRNRRDAAKELLGKIYTAKERISALTEAKTVRETNRQELAVQKAAIEEKKKKSADMDTPIHDAEIGMKIRKEDLEKQKDTIDKFASTLRLKLRIGDVCPVCRQKIEEEFPHEEELSVLVKNLQTVYDTAEKEYKDLVSKKITLEAEIKAQTESYDSNCRAFAEDKSVENAGKRTLEACGACGIEDSDQYLIQGDEGSVLTVLDAAETETAKQYETLDKQIKEGENKENEVKKRRKALDASRGKIEKLAEEESVAEKAVGDCKMRIATAEAVVDTKKQDVALAEQKVAEFITIGKWDIDWKESPKEFATALSLSEKEYSNHISQKQMLLRKQGEAKLNFSNVSSIIASIVKAMPEWGTMESGVAIQIDDLLDRANGIQHRITVAITQLTAKEKVLKMNKVKLEEFLTAQESLTMERLIALCAYAANDILREDTELKKDRDAVVAGRTLVDNARKLLAEHLLNKPELTETETIDFLNEQIGNYEIRLSEIVERKGAINQEIKIDRENKERLSSLIEDEERKSAEYQKWSRMNQLIGDATGSKFRKIAQSYVLSSLIHSANHYMKSLTDRYTLKVAPESFVISLEDAYQGFVSRAASTISGGESFLVSLSLALALSDIGQTLSVDTLFIDEGFGTLSGEPLQNAINTLRSLHTKAGRHVGIISHVEELQERIPVQIQVNQDGNNSSSKVRIIPENI